MVKVAEKSFLSKSMITYPYFIALTLFLFDTILLHLLESPLISTLICFYAILLLRQKSPWPLIFTLLLISLQSLLLFNTFGLTLFFIVPLSIMALEIAKFLQKTGWIPYFFLLLSIISTDIISLWPMGISHLNLLLGIKISVNMVILVIFDILVPKKVI